MGAAMAEHADKLGAAAQARDAAQAGEIVSQMDTVCESCHSRYWYPE
jgi:cytochrome c556